MTTSRSYATSTLAVLLLINDRPKLAGSVALAAWARRRILAYWETLIGSGSCGVSGCTVRLARVIVEATVLPAHLVQPSQSRAA